MTLQSKTIGLLVVLGTACASVPPTHAEESSAKAGTTHVTTGVVIRGVTIGGPAGAPGTPTGKTCDFSKRKGWAGRPDDWRQCQLPS